MIFYDKASLDDAIQQYEEWRAKYIAEGRSARGINAILEGLTKLKAAMVAEGLVWISSAHCAEARFADVIHPN